MDRDRFQADVYRGVTIETWRLTPGPHWVGAAVYNGDAIAVSRGQKTREDVLKRLKAVIRKDLRFKAAKNPRRPGGR